MDTDVEARAIRRWRRTISPAWLPRSQAQMADDTAAALSQLHHPRSWRSVTITPAGGGHFVMHVEYRRGYPQAILLGDWQSVQDVANLVNDNVRLAAAKRHERKRLRDEWRGARFTVSITGTDPKARSERAARRPPAGTPRAFRRAA